MSKDETPRSGLLSKVARFVLHPTVNWSDLDSRLPGAGTEADRQALKAAIERKRRNDQVRQREFNKLRTLLQQRRLASGHAAERESQLPAAEASGQSVRKETTIEKIAQIEAQMSQHWLARRPGEGGGEAQRTHIGSATVARDYDGGVTRPAHLQATQPATFAGSALADHATTVPIDMLAETVPEAGQGSGGSSVAVEEAAVRFANGDDQAAELALRAALAQDPGSPTGRMAWQALLDLLAAQGLREPYDDAAGEYAVLFRVAAPAWPVRRSVAEVAPAVPALPSWTCPMVLDVAAVQSLRAVLRGAGACKLLDWSALLSADVAAAQALLELMEQVAEQEVVLRFAGGSVLRRRLKASTPSGRRENDPVWWRLRLAMLRVMCRPEEFDLAALDFCVTYGVLPPDWVAPRNRFEAAEQAVLGAAIEPDAPVIAEPIKPLVTQLGGLDVLEWPTMSTDTPPIEAVSGVTAGVLSPVLGASQPDGAVSRPAGAILSGALCGEIGAQIGALQGALASHQRGRPFVIDCAQLVRVDFPAAGSLLQWLLGAIAQGVQPELTGVGRLVGAFLHVVGVDEAAPVRLREY